MHRAELSLWMLEELREQVGDERHDVRELARKERGNGFAAIQRGKRVGGGRC